MASTPVTKPESNQKAPSRPIVEWRNPEFYDEALLFKEMDRVFDICHGCRRCVSLCHSFPVLFDAVDASETMEVDGINKQKVYWEVVDHCYLCDMCYMTKCPYVPPHPWSLDLPHLLLRAKAIKYQKGDIATRDRLLTSTDAIGKLASIPVVVEAVNAANRNKTARKIMDKVLGIHPEATLPRFHSRTAEKRLADHRSQMLPQPTEKTRGKVALFATCYGNFNEPHLGDDLVAVFEHNGIPVTLATGSRCCSMPKLELGDLMSVERDKDHNVALLATLVDEGYDIVAPVPSCVLMFKQELPLLFPDDARVIKVRDAIYDPFEYLALRHAAGLFNVEFKTALGKIAYHVACHLRVQNIGLKTRDILSLIPGTEVEPLGRCSGHNGTYAMKSEYHDTSMEIGKPVMDWVQQGGFDHYGSDCPMAGHQIANGLRDGVAPTHPMTLLRQAYGI